LKTNGAGFSILDKENILDRIKEIKSQFPSDWKLPNVYLLHGQLSIEEMNYLYNHPKVKAMVSFTHGEGFGRPMLEATMTGLPVIASNWSGQLDFLNEEVSMLLPGKLSQIPKSVVWNDILIEQSEWFTVDENVAYKAFNYAFENFEELKSKAKEQMKLNEKYTLKNMSVKLHELLDSHMKSAPVAVGLNLPKLKKTSDDKSNKITLPKLKKV